MKQPWSLASSSPAEVERLVRELDLSPVTASVLARRGLDDPERAAAFLEPDAISHDVARLGDVDAALGLLRAAIETGARVCVHGDYDVDGICATALAYTVLRDLGADVDEQHRVPRRRLTRPPAARHHLLHAEPGHGSIAETSPCPDLLPRSAPMLGGGASHLALYSSVTDGTSRCHP